MAHPPENPLERLKAVLGDATRRMIEDFEPTDLAFDPNKERVASELEYLAGQLSEYAVSGSVPKILMLRTESGQELTTVRRMELEQLRGLAEVSYGRPAEKEPTEIHFLLPVDYVQEGNVTVLFRPAVSSLSCRNSKTVQAIAASVGEQEHIVLWTAMHAQRQDLYRPEEWVVDALDYSVAVRRGDAVYSRVYFMDHKTNNLQKSPSMRKTRGFGRESIQLLRQYCLFPQEAQPAIDLFVKFGSVHILQEGSIEKKKSELRKKQRVPVGSP